MTTERRLIGEEIGSLYIWHCSGPCGDVYHLGQSLNSTQLDWKVVAFHTHRFKTTQSGRLIWGYDLFQNPKHFGRLWGSLENVLIDVASA